MRIEYLQGFCLSLMVPLHHLGLLILVLSGFLSYNTGVPTSNLGNSLPVLDLTHFFESTSQLVHHFKID